MRRIPTRARGGTVLFVLDASAEIGAGHAIRCLALAEELLARGYQIAHVGRLDIDWVAAEYRNVGIRSVGPRHPLDAVADIAPRTVVIDSYTLSVETSEALAACGKPTMAIIDRETRGLVADLYLDQNAAATPEALALGADQALCGLRYALLRQRILANRSQPWGRWREGNQPHVVVVFGGTDPIGGAVLMAGLLARTGRSMTTTVVTATQANARAVRALPWAANQDLRVLMPTSRLVDTLATADLVVSAAGSTVLELMALGLPIAACVAADNQKHNYQAGIDMGLIVGLGSITDLSSDPRLGVARLRELLDSTGAREEIAGRAHRAVDGKGRTRVADRFLALLDDHSPRPAPASQTAEGGREDRVSAELTVRAATKQDERVVLEWRNDAESRAQSRNLAPIDSDTHNAWFAGLLSDHERILLIGEHQGLPCGSVRFDPWPHRALGDVEISVTVAPFARGQGLGRRLIAAAEDHLRRSCGHAKVLANIKPGNAASLRLFLSSGYRVEARVTQPGLWLFKDLAVASRG